MDIKEQASTSISIRIDLYLKNWPKVASFRDGHPSKPQNASKLRLGLNIYHIPLLFHQLDLQDVG